VNGFALGRTMELSILHTPWLHQSMEQQ